MTAQLHTTENTMQNHPCHPLSPALAMAFLLQAVRHG